MLTLPTHYASIQRCDHWSHGDGDACVWIRSLVCGLPSTLRQKWRLIVFDVWIDDSGKEGPPAYLLAGYVERPNQWMGFADDWRAVLNKPPRLEYFKAEEAFSRREQFAGWNEDDRDRRVLELVAVIRKYRLTAIRSRIPVADFDRIVKQNRGPFKNPCYFGVMAIMIGLATEMREHPEIEGFDIFIDEDVVRPGDLKRAYQIFMAKVSERERAIFPREPVFRDDKKFLPLQAADLFAWHARREYREAIEGRKLETPVWSALRDAHVHLLNCDCDTDLMEQIVAGMPTPWPRQLGKPRKLRKGERPLT